jgi:DNA-directed RNA polymerase subunit RPC12/RpoP
MTGLFPFLAFTGVLTAGLVAAIVIDAALAWVAVPIYVVAMGYALYRVVAWQSANLAFVCQECGASFAADLKTWLVSPNMGIRKLVTCPECGRQTWAREVRRSEVGPSSD